MIAMSMADIEAINAFKEEYPTWWWKIGWCDLTRDFDCAPQAHSPEMKYSKVGDVWDLGFHADHEGTIAQAIYYIMHEIEDAIVYEEYCASKVK